MKQENGFLLTKGIGGKATLVAKKGAAPQSQRKRIFWDPITWRCFLWILSPFLLLPHQI